MGGGEFPPSNSPRIKNKHCVGIYGARRCVICGSGYLPSHLLDSFGLSVFNMFVCQFIGLLVELILFGVEILVSKALNWFN